ncbi:MAG: hypothetical protein K6B52_00690 [Clostridiales bacterium]|nr:hypothetical protein [Clostridiales bacterium]
MKRLICALLALTLIVSFSVAAFADVIPPGEQYTVVTDSSGKIKVIRGIKKKESERLHRMNAITLSILCVAGGIAVSAAGTAALISKKNNNKHEENTL